MFNSIAGAEKGKIFLQVKISGCTVLSYSASCTACMNSCPANKIIIKKKVNNIHNNYKKSITNFNIKEQKINMYMNKYNNYRKIIPVYLLEYRCCA